MSRAVDTYPEAIYYTKTNNDHRHPLSQTSIVTRLLPHLDTLHLHIPLSLPSRIPLITSLPKLPLSIRTSIYPRFVRLAVFEPVVRSTDSDIQHQVEVLIERRVIFLGFCPWVEETRSVAGGEWEFAVVPHRLGEASVHYLEEAGVYVCVDVVFAPLIDVSGAE